jgi:UDP-2,3-diacylglucosamine pyrophosphatase LpxH
VRYPLALRDNWRTFAHRRLTQAFASAIPVPFDDSSRIIFFSDCHRGINNRADAFARNQGLFLGALGHYYQQGYTYIEVGDGDELWKNRRMGDIRNAHPRVFDLLEEFNRQERLHLIFGNHDIARRMRRQLDKGGLIAHEALLLRHANSGRQIFVVHGHQADFKSGELYMVSRLVVRHMWTRLQLHGLVGTGYPTFMTEAQRRIEGKIIEWVQAERQLTICGHTHQPASTRAGAPLYFNTGSCIHPGSITGLELEDGELRLVKWVAQPDAGGRQVPAMRREAMAPPRVLKRLE